VSVCEFVCKSYKVIAYDSLSLSRYHACCPYDVLRAVFTVAKAEVKCTRLFTVIYTRTGMKMSRFIIREHPRTQLHHWISPIFIPTSNHILPGRRRGRRRPHSVSWT